MIDTTTTVTAGIVSGTVSGAASGAAYIAFINGLAPEVILGAFCGALIFMFSAEEHSIISRILYAPVSFLMAILFARPSGNLLFNYLSTSFGYTGDIKWIEMLTAFLVAVFGLLVLLWLKKRGLGLFTRWLQNKVGGRSNE